MINVTRTHLLKQWLTSQGYTSWSSDYFTRTRLKQWLPHKDTPPEAVITSQGHAWSSDYLTRTHLQQWLPHKDTPAAVITSQGHTCSSDYLTRTHLQQWLTSQGHTCSSDYLTRTHLKQWLSHKDTPEAVITWQGHTWSSDYSSILWYTRAPDRLTTTQKCTT